MTTNPAIKVFAPATVANVASGFDILGFAIDGVGDILTLTPTPQSGITMTSITGVPGTEHITLDPSLNTAGVPLLKMWRDFCPAFGLEVQIKKGIPLGSGMGGSAASAVAAVVAANHLLVQKKVLSKPLDLPTLLEFALEGEAVASGAKHADNIAPCLYGGLTLSQPGAHPDVVRLPFPTQLFCILIHPPIRIDTKTARSILKPDLTLHAHTVQSGILASLIAGFCTSDLALIKRGLVDILVEPQRSQLITGFDSVKGAALDEGALGCSISGSGPAIFAFAASETSANRIKLAMLKAFKQDANLEAQTWISPIRVKGAALV